MSSFNEKIFNVVSEIANNSVNPFKGKWVSILGDSISSFTGYIPSGQSHVMKDTMPTVDTIWWHQLITKLGAKLCVNYSGSGMCISGTDPTHGACYNDFEKQLHREAGQTYVNLDGTTETATTRVDPDVIFVYLGTNDYYNSSNLGSIDMGTELVNPNDDVSQNNVLNCLQYILYQLIVNYPYACVYVISPQLIKHQTEGSITFPFFNAASTPWSMAELMEETRKICLKTRAKWIPLANYCLSGSRDYQGTDQFLLSDGIHPTATGNKIIADICYNNMMKDPISWNTRNDITK